jgi:magnesium transporter
MSMTERYSPLSRLDAQPDEEDLFDYYYDEQGSIPGTLRLPKDASPTEIILIDYNEAERTRLQLEKPEDCIRYLDTESVSWMDVLGLGSEDILRRLGKVFKLHPLVLEDIVNVPQRPKVEDYENQLLIISQMVLLKENTTGFWNEQVSFVLGKHYLLTVQEEPTRDCFQAVRDRIRSGKGIIRKQGADYLTYTLIDSIIDGFFPYWKRTGSELKN